MDLIIRFLGTFIAIYGFAVVQETPKRYLVRAALVGAISGVIYWVSIKWGAGEVSAAFYSAIMAAMLSHIFARVYKVPVTLFLVAGILPTVPGAGMYRTVSNFIAENDTLTMINLTQTLQTAGVIALAIFIVDSLFGVSRKNVSILESEIGEEEIDS